MSENAPSQPWPKPATAWYTLCVLSVVLALSQIDRNVFTLLIQPIKRDLQLSDTQIGVLVGLAFSSVYLLLSLPFSRLSDSKSRTIAITCGLAFWSLATAACGLAQTYTQMLVARAGVGAGESVNGPATYSMLADNFPRERLPRAMAILNVGYLGGLAFSLIVGGAILGLLASHTSVTLPLVGAVRSWQVVFFAVGLPGLLVALLLLTTVPEPARRGDHGGRDAVPVGEVVRYFRRNWLLYGSIFLGIFLSATETSGMATWSAPFFQRTYGWSPQRVGLVTGLVALLVSPLGLVLGTWLTERWNKKHDDGNIRVALVAYIASVPFVVARPLMPTAELAVVCGAIGSIINLMGHPPLVAAIQSITPNRLRAQISSVYLMMVSGISGIIGPMFIAAITDYVLKDESKLRFALTGSAAIVLPIAALVMAAARKPYGRAIAEIKRGA